MIDENGKVSADPAELAGMLRRHWAKTFTAKPIDRGWLQVWLRQAFMHDERGRAITGLPEASSARWRISRKEIGKAIRMSGNTMPGPDMIPYKAWRVLGDFATDTLFDTSQDLVKEDAIRPKGDFFEIYR